MSALLIMLKNVIIFVLLAVPGYLLVKGKKLEAKDSAPLSKILTNVGMPFLILSSTLKLEFTGEFTKTMIITGILGTVFILLMFLVSGFLVRRGGNVKRRGMARFCMIFANNGFIGIPLAQAVFGEASAVVAYLIVLNILNNVLMFSLGVYLILGDRRAIDLKKAIFNPVLIAFMIGIALNLAGVSKAIPEMQTYSDYFRGIVTPLSMVILGMKLAGVKMRALFTTGRMYYVAALRLVVFPVAGVAMMLALQKIAALSISNEVILAFFVAAAMPTAGLASAFSDQYGGDTENAVIFTLGTTILSVAVIPVLYWALRLMV